MICFRLLESDDPATPLAEAVATLRRGEDAESVYAVNPKSFRQVPNAPFAYWVSERIRGLFTELPPFESEGREVRVGLQTSDDFRFVRTAWETPEAGTHQGWFPFAKGGSYSPFYADIHLHVNWETNGKQVRHYGDPNGARSKSRPQNSDYYFRPGLTWTVFTTRELSPRLLPRGCVLSHVGGAAFAKDQLLIGLCALVASSTFRNLLSLTMGLADAGRRVYGVGSFSVSPIPSSCNTAKIQAKSAWSLKRHLDTTNSNSHAFYAPALTPGQCTAPRLTAEPGGTR